MWLVLPWLLACAPAPLAPGGDADTAAPVDALPLRWVPVAGEPWEEALDGLWWSLAGLGASPDPGAVADVVPDREGVRFTLDPALLGLSPPARAALEEALAPVEAARVAQGMPWIDVGRLLQRTLYEPWVYSAVTGACETLPGQSARLPDAPPEVAITDSLLTEGDRRLRFVPDPASAAEIAWFAEEGEGSLVTGDFVARATEVVDVMPNGRFRYAVYDAAGALAPAADAAHTPAGQPGRCMWCHENHLMTTVVQPEVPGHLAFEDFAAAIGAQQDQVEALRAAQGGVVDWQTHAVHTWGEVLVEGFLRAPTARLAAEWGVAPETVEAWMAADGVLPIENEEYPGWGPVWRRAEADAVFARRRGALPTDHPLAGTTGAPLPVLPSARELPDPDAALWVPPYPHACGEAGAPGARAE